MKLCQIEKRAEENRTVSAGVVGQEQVAKFVQMHCKYDSVPRNIIAKSVNQCTRASEAEKEKRVYVRIRTSWRLRQ